jgi:tetratricopeptide (TPR) repeat protein
MLAAVKEIAMRSFMLAAAGAALALGAWTAAGQAQAFETVIGGLAGACSTAAKAAEHDPRSIDMCTMALQQEALNQHDLAGTYVNRGAMELLNKDYEFAHSDFDKAISIKPNMGEAHIGEGVYLISMQRWPEAEAEVSRGLDMGSEEPEKGYYFRGLARWGQENFKGAYLDFQKASELKPNWSLPRQQMSNFKVERVN